MYKVVYDVKDKNGFLQTKTQKFNTVSEAMEFVRSLNGAVGRPVLEKQ